MTVIDLKRELRELYLPPHGKIVLVDVPELRFLMVDGHGDPSATPTYREAVEALYTVSFALRRLLRQAPEPLEYRVMPLEGLWWTQDMNRFDLGHKAAWSWTAMIAQPDAVDEALFTVAAAEASHGRELPALVRMRLRSFREGLAAQLLHVGAYGEGELPDVRRLHAFIAERGFVPAGRHHEIYLSDPRRTAPERLRTVIRQPVAR